MPALGTTTCVYSIYFLVYFLKDSREKRINEKEKRSIEEYIKISEQNQGVGKGNFGAILVQIAQSKNIFFDFQKEREDA
jgi:hypothetical protein